MTQFEFSTVTPEQDAQAAAEWRRKQGAKITHYAVYCPIPGRPLPPIEALEVPADAFVTLGNDSTT